MEKPQIIERLKTMKTGGDLASLLDSIKQDEFAGARYGISEKMLRHFASDRIAPKRFRTFRIPKKSGGLRVIKAPCRQLELILKCVNIMLDAVYQPSDAAMGFTRGRSVVDNARVHVGQNYVFNIDLKDFFPSIVQARVWKRLQVPPFCFTQEVAGILAGLCCTHDDDEAGANVLPQGSPASPLLTNAICDRLDRRMNGVARRFGLHYSRYADDMTFSSMHNVYREESEFRTEVRRIVAGEGFRMNESKTRLSKRGARQEVTGLTVNAVANVSRRYVSDLRWILSVWEREGYATAYARFYPKYKKEKGYIKKGEPVMENVVGGKLNYLRMVRGAGNAAYRKLAARYAALQQLVFIDSDTDKGKSYVYVQPYPIADFERLFHTKVSLEVSRGGKLVGSCEIDGRRKVLAVGRTTQKALCPELGSLQPGDAVESEGLEKCYVTLCRNKGKNFWLITKSEPKRSRCLSIQNLNVTPDELLELWEKNGFEDTADELALFIRFGRREESILTWNPLADNGEDEVDRGEVMDGAPYLIGYFMSRQLTALQRSRLNRLLAAGMHASAADSNKAKEAEAEKESVAVPEKQLLKSVVVSGIDGLRKRHNPTLTAKFLSLFGAPDGMKFLIHDFDPESGRSIAFTVEQTQALISSPEYNFKLPKSLYGLMNGFINGPKWTDYAGKEHNVFLTSKAMTEWCGRYPMLHPMTSSEFGREIQCFRNTVRLSKPDFQKRLSALTGSYELLQTLRIQTKGLDKADFYTNVAYLFNVILKRVLFDIEKRDPDAEVAISYDRSAWNEYRLLQLRVVHRGSEANPLDAVREKLQSGGGDMFELAKGCAGYCDWAVEANFEGEAMRWRILDSRNLPETETLNVSEVEGFTHIFTFYKYK